jgi:MFS family permease
VRSALGGRFWRIWMAAGVSTLGDGVREVALPLLATTITRDPALVAAVSLAGRLPWLLLSLVSGALVDRLDRRRVMGTVDVVRAGIVLALALTVTVAATSVALLCVIAFALGTGETLFDNAAQAIMPSVVRRDQLESANSRLYTAQVVSFEFVGPPLGALLFAMAAELPFVVDGLSFAVAAALVLTMAGSYRPVRPAGPPTRLRTEIAEGLRWLWAHRLLRTLGLMLGIWNLLTTAIISVFVLFALETLGLSKVGYGLLFTGAAVGSLLGTLTATGIIARLGHAVALLGAVFTSAIAYLVIALTSSPVLVGIMFAVGGLTSVVWNVITVSLRQSIIPDALLGRVNSVYRFLGWGTMPIGAAVGGVLAKGFGLRAPFFVSAGVLAIMGVAALPVVNRRTIEAARARSHE